MGLIYRPKDRHGDPLPPLSDRFAALRNIIPFLRMVWGASPLYCAGVIAVRALNGLTPLAMLWVAKLMIDTVVGNIGAASPDWSVLVRLILLEVAIALAADLLARATGLLESLLGDLFSRDLAVRIMQKAALADLQHFEDPEYLDKMRRARIQAGSRVALMSQSLGMAQDLLTLSTLVIGLIAFEPWLVLMLMVALMPAFLGETAYAGVSYSFLFRWTRQRRELDYYQWVMSELEPAKEVKLFDLADHFVDKYATLADDYIAENRRIATHRATTGAMLNSLSIGAHYAAVGVIAYQTVMATISVGTLTFLIGAFQRSRGLMGSILMTIAHMYEQGLHIKDLFEFLELDPELANESGARKVAAPLTRGLVFDRVSFRYPGAEKWAVRDVSFTIEPTERIALIGENGAGKTTLVKLLARLYEPTDGRILLDGSDIREYDIKSFRRAIAVIFQDFFRYDLTIHENIAVGAVDAISDRSRVEASARSSLATEVMARFPEGYGQLLGTRFEGGANLSGGEWQKIALARAYFRQAQILVLDEPTAALDARSEHEVFRRFSDSVAGRAAIIISHRFSTVRMADRVFVLDRGSILESGSHDELLRAGGRYSELFELQAAGYR